MRLAFSTVNTISYTREGRINTRGEWFHDPALAEGRKVRLHERPDLFAPVNGTADEGGPRWCVQLVSVPNFVRDEPPVTKAPNLTHDWWFELKENAFRCRFCTVKRDESLEGKYCGMREANLRRASQPSVRDSAEWGVVDGPSLSDLGVVLVPGYEALVSVLLDAYQHAARGKGADRHADAGLSFVDQRIVQDAVALGSVQGPAYQVLKKTKEATRLYARGDEGGAHRNVLGAINYLAAMVLVHAELTAAGQVPTVASCSDKPEAKKTEP